MAAMTRPTAGRAEGCAGGCVPPNRRGGAGIVALALAGLLGVLPFRHRLALVRGVRRAAVLAVRNAAR